MEKALLLGDEKRELEILEFTAGGNSYGIDIVDIREILPYDEAPTRIPNAHPYIEGVAMPRDFLIPIVNVTKSLKLSSEGASGNGLLIVTSINQLNISFHVDEVVGLHRATTANVTKPGRKLSTPVKSAISGILHVGAKKIEIVEFRNIIAEINPNVEFG